MHHDMKLENVLLNDDFEPAVRDFRLTGVCQADKESTMNVWTQMSLVISTDMPLTFMHIGFV
jgi:hypothetical protein